MLQRPASTSGFTLVEALLAATLMSMATVSLWNGYAEHLRVQARLERESEDLSALAALSERLSSDLESARRVRLAGPAGLSIRSADGTDVEYAGSGSGLVRTAGRVSRRFAALRLAALTRRVVGGRPVLFARVRFPAPPGQRPHELTLVRALPEEGRP